MTTPVTAAQTQPDSTDFNPEYYALARPEMYAFLPDKPKRVLEVGCGAGQFAGELKDAEVWGIEPMAAPVAVAAKRYHKVLVGFFNDFKDDLPKGYFDLIICNDVIEHMVDHEAFLEASKAYLSPDGVLVGSIPNVRYYKNLVNLLGRRQWEYTDDGILDRTHMRFFTDRSLMAFFDRHGYDVERFQGINGEFNKGWLYASTLFGLAMIAVTFGAWRDIAHMQFAFRLRPRKS